MSPTEKPYDLLLLGEEIEPFWGLLELNPFAVQVRYEAAGAAFSNFESLARLTEQLLTRVQSLLASG